MVVLSFRTIFDCLWWHQAVCCGCYCPRPAQRWRLLCVITPPGGCSGLFSRLTIHYRIIARSLHGCRRPSSAVVLPRWLGTPVTVAQQVAHMKPAAPNPAWTSTHTLPHPAPKPCLNNVEGSKSTLVMSSVSNMGRLATSMYNCLLHCSIERHCSGPLEGHAWPCCSRIPGT